MPLTWQLDWAFWQFCPWIEVFDPATATGGGEWGGRSIGSPTRILSRRGMPPARWRSRQWSILDDRLPLGLRVLLVVGRFGWLFTHRSAAALS